MNHIALPVVGADLHVIASVSGGKDSTALILALREAEIRARHVFADTGWEASETYAYLDLLRERLGITIDVVRAASGGMRQSIRARARFPGRMQRWCTKELKLVPLRAYHDEVIRTDAHHADSINVMGVRADESVARSTMPEWEDDPEWGGYLWRPLIAWTIPDVLKIHRRHGIPVNPLYQRGHNRVGCYPCIYASKEEIRLVAEHSPDRIDEIRDLESFCTDERARRNEVEQDRYTHPIASYFQTRYGRRVCQIEHDHDDNEGEDCKRKLIAGPPMQIDAIVEWARTDRGGRQMPLFAPQPTGGCMRWGLCETSPSKDDV